ncbi:hypothetical protein AV540_18135 [Brevibacillus parabrevis]|uniref:hypothetical protein n=1 Tax=Brevibacillus parabrevis TaxID=54914 RepID=UPI0007ABB2E6|nr:hypothetical protein [Brevibacillus parabrevis]KZE47954.1 hypothetical protein AV540_18135 [Brevibacillus parabrevis]
MPKNLLFLLVLVLLTGCSGKRDETLSAPVVVQAFADAHMPLVQTNVSDYFVLSGVSPEKYTVNDNHLFLYVFTSEEDAKKGLEDFQEQIQALNLVIPQIFEAKNVLLFYLTPGTRTDSFSDRDPQISSIVQSLLSSVPD